jgi:ABC-type multidrug transport system fused ATPase/permease subunit
VYFYARLSLFLDMAKTYSYTSIHIRQHSAGILLIILLGLVNSLATFLLPVSIGDFFSIQYQEDGTKSKLLHSIGIHLTTAGAFCIFFSSLIAVKFITGYIQSYLSNKQGELFVKSFREKVFSAQVGWTEDAFKEKPFGNYLLRYSNDMKGIQGYLVKGILDAVKNILFLLTGLLLLAKINPIIALVVLLFLITVIPFFSILWKKQKQLVTVSRSKRSNMLAFVAGKFSRFNSLKVRQQEAAAVQRFTDKSLNLYTANLAAVKIESLIQGLIGILPFLLIGLLLVLQYADVLHIDHTRALTAILILLMLQTPIKAILKVPGILNKGSLSIQKVDELVKGK